MRINNKKVRGAIFDVDGTILDSMPMWDQIAEKYLLEQGMTPRENLNETFKTMSLQESARYYQEVYNVTKSQEEIIDGVNHLIEREYRENLKLKPGVKELLNLLDSNNIKLTIATATNERLIKAALKRNELLSYFDAIITCDQIGKSKEYPDIYIEAANRMNTDPQATIVFEDAFHAMKTAKDAGFQVVAVYDHSECESRKQIEKTTDIYIKSWTEMESYIEL